MSRQQHNRKITQGDIGNIGSSPKVIFRKNGTFAFTFGKHKGCSSEWIPDYYLKWVLENVDFTKKELKRIERCLKNKQA